MYRRGHSVPNRNVAYLYTTHKLPVTGVSVYRFSSGRSTGPNGRQEAVHFLLTRPLASRLVTQSYI